jgi:uncharacterized membrane protein YagU involved in acid resistance
MKQIEAGTISGFCATIPMTLAMKAMHSKLPVEERYPLPPREITMNVAEAAGVKKMMSQPARLWATYVGHFGYGAFAGAGYALLTRKPRRRDAASSALKGMGYGLAVWAGSYIGWLPAVGLFPPPTTEPPRRSLLMIGAHLVWGGVTGVLVDQLRVDQRRAQSRSAS